MKGFERLLLRNFDVAGRALAAQLVGRAVRAILALFTLAGTTIFIGVTFQNLVAPWLLDLWLAAMAVVITSPVLLTLAFAIHGPGTEEALRPYALISRTLSFSLSVLIASSIWILLPHAGAPLQLMMIVLYVAFVAMMLGADGGPALMIEQLGVMVSVIAFVLIDRLPYAVPLAVVLGAFGLSLVGLHRLAYRSTQAAIVARAETERVNAALQGALADVAAERDAKTRFIAAASHDLRQPIQAAALYFDHAMSNAEPGLRERAVAGAKRAFGSVDALLETMLEHLRLEAGAASARLECVALDPVLADVMIEHGPAAQAAGIRLGVVRSGRSVSADDRMLRRVLRNVVGNAIRHSAGKRILLGARQTGDEIGIWVIDDGCGIAAADVARLFDDYVQGNGSEPVSGGFGIGLSSSRRMMALMQGAIALDQRWRNGSAFHLRLPQGQSDMKGKIWKAA